MNIIIERGQNYADKIDLNSFKELGFSLTSMMSVKTVFIAKITFIFRNCYKIRNEMIIH